MDDTNLQTAQATQNPGEVNTPGTTDDNGGGGAAVDPAVLERENQALKEKFANSAREAQVLSGKVKELEEKLKGSSLTDDEVKQEYPEWDQLTQNEQRLARENLSMRRNLSNISMTLNDLSYEKQLQQIKQQNPGLTGRESDFEQFCKKPTHKGVSLEVLAKAFLFEVESDDPARKAPKKEVKGLETGVPVVPKAAIKKEEYTTAQIEDIYKNDKKRYNDLVRAGKI